MSSDPIGSLEASLVELRRRQRRHALAAHLPIAERRIADIVDAVAASPEPVSVADVAVALAVDPSQASRRVAAAVEAGVVRRAAAQHDGRVSVIELTAEGRRLLDGMQSARRDLIRRATTGWSAADRRQFADLLARFVADLDQPAP